MLKVALKAATENWETLMGGGLPCPIVFDAEDVRKTKKLDDEQVARRRKQLKMDALAAAGSEEERARPRSRRTGPLTT